VWSLQLFCFIVEDDKVHDGGLSLIGCGLAPRNQTKQGGVLYEGENDSPILRIEKKSQDTAASGLMDCHVTGPSSAYLY